MKKAVKIPLIVLGSIIGLALIMVIAASAGMGSIKRMDIETVDLADVSDGTYTGRFKKSRWDYSVEVTVSGREIIEVAPLNVPSDKISREFFEKAGAAVEEKQSTDIDVVGGATVNTKAFRQAVTNALKSGRE
ncbi:MAG: FMN-binding protein [Spirochaetota bacterium]